MATKNDRGQRLREHRKEQNKTIKECAKEAEVAVTTWQKWEYGQSEPKDFDTAERACKAAGISLDKWVTGQECMPKLPINEQQLLDAYRLLNPDLQKSLVTIVMSIHKAESETTNDPI
jgi:transcriptional regulator with XRE-family HTH domain